jgi:FxsC-like protein
LPCPWIAAPSRRELALPELSSVPRDPQYYGEHARDWAPYRPSLDSPVADFALAIAMEREFQAVVTNLQDFADRQTLDDDNQIIVLLVDLWSTRVAEHRRALRRFDQAYPHSLGQLAAVMVPANYDDQQTQAHLSELLDSLRRIFVRRSGQSHDVTFRASILSPQAFDADLRVVLERSRNRILNTGTVYRRPSGRRVLEVPVLASPVPSGPSSVAADAGGMSRAPSGLYVAGPTPPTGAGRPSSSPDVSGGQSTANESIEVVVYLGTDSQLVAEETIRAVDQVAAVLGYESLTEQERWKGSIWRRAKATLNGVTSEEVHRRLVKVERILELAQLDNRQAEVDQKMATAVNQLIVSLNPIPRACIRVGSLLVIKYPGDDGHPVLLVRNLTQIEIRALERYPEIQGKPHCVLDALATAVEARSRPDPERWLVSPARPRCLR